MRLNQAHAGALRSFTAACMLLVAGRDGLAQDTKEKQVLEAIKNHFKTVTPELRRYEGVTLYGETLSGTALTKQDLERERALFKDAASAGLLKALTPEVLVLAHNLIVHDPAAAATYLKTLHESDYLTKREVVPGIYAATLAARELGEQMAVAELLSKKKDRRLFWARYLQHCALYLSSVEPIHKHLATESEAAVKTSLIWSLSQIGSPKSVALVKDFIEHAAEDEVQAAAIFSYAEFAGFDGIAYVEAIKPLGEKAAAERRTSLQWLKEETRPDSKHGREMNNDSEFVSRFADLHASPVIRWLNKEHRLEKTVLKENPKLSAEKKNELLDLLVDSKGFGLEAVKGSLFRSLSKEDEPLLLKIRCVGFCSPNDLSMRRLKTIGIMIRQLRQEP
ncbi:MAG TPA: hypothetical protein VH120_03540 [Gemmataceae bacterium]|nr:hypothetical protein [Gemmataceae bacterium]